MVDMSRVDGLGTAVPSKVGLRFAARHRVRGDPRRPSHLSALSDGNAYLRVGDQSHRFNALQHRELVFDRGGSPYEATPVGLDVADLDQEQLQSYAGAIGSATIDAMLAARGLVDCRGRLTVGACLLFDKHPQRDLPALVDPTKHWRSRGTRATPASPASAPTSASRGNSRE